MSAKRPTNKQPGATLSRGERAHLVLRADVGSMKLKTALFVLDQFSGQQDHCWPSLPLIASCMCASTRTAQYAIKQLVDRGFIKFRDDRPGFSSRTYMINYERLSGAESAPVGCKPCTGGVQTTTASGAESAPEIYKQTDKRNDNKHAPVNVPPTSGGASEAHQRIRQRAESVKRLQSLGVWDQSIPELIDIAAASDGGNPLRRVHQVCDEAERQRKDGAWISSAIREGWKFNKRRRAS